jgi:hypothetical protein
MHRRDNFSLAKWASNTTMPPPPAAAAAVAVDDVETMALRSDNAMVNGSFSLVDRDLLVFRTTTYASLLI